MEKLIKNEVIEICLTTQNDYYEDYLGDEWLSLPAEKDELENALKTIKACSSSPAYISTYCTGLESLERKIESDNSFVIGETAIYKLNELAKSICNIPPEDYPIIDAIAEQVGGFDDAVRIYQEHEYRIYKGCTTMEDVAYEIISSGIYDSELSDFAKDFFDYESFGDSIVHDNIYVPVEIKDVRSILEIFC